jgi:hypothetical protein
MRLDSMFAALWPKIEAGNLAAIDRAIRISARRSILFGLNASPASNRAAGCKAR